VSSRGDVIRRWLGVAAPLAAAALLYVAYHQIGKELFDGYRLDLGSKEFPSVREVHHGLCVAVFGVPIAGLFALSLVRVASLSARVRRALELFPDSDDDRPWVAFGALAAFLVPFGLRMLALDDAAIADDESAYLFGGQLVAGGRLTVPSPEMKLFFDRTFMINDGRLYPMYPMGWPILMAPGVLLGAAGYMNALYSALTVPAVYIAAREIGSARIARASVLLFVSSPMLMVGAATMMANTSCLFALAWTLAAYLRTRRPEAPLHWHAAVGAFLGIAALIRPSSALGTGGPILLFWAADTLRGPRAEVPRRLVAIAVPGLLALGLLVGINKAQNGSYTLFSYVREVQYAKENGFRFNNWGVPGLRELASTANPHLQSRAWTSDVANAGIAVLRLDLNLFGWFPSLVLAAFAAKRRGAALLGAMVAGHFIVHAGVLDPGIDTFGPHHYFETAVPLVLLTALGISAIAQWMPSDRLAPGALVVGLTLFAVTSTFPQRVRALSEMAADVNFVRDRLAAEKVSRAVVFAPRPFTASFARCGGRNARHFVYWRPNNDPWLKNDILYVNHVSIEEDQKLMTKFPDRPGIVFFFGKDCRRELVSIDAPDAPARVPNGDVDGIGTGIVGRDFRP
jgi:hypothetical protein